MITAYGSPLGEKYSKLSHEERNTSTLHISMSYDQIHSIKLYRNEYNKTFYGQNVINIFCHGS